MAGKPEPKAHARGIVDRNSTFRQLQNLLADRDEEGNPLPSARSLVEKTKVIEDALSNVFEVGKKGAPAKFKPAILAELEGLGPEHQSAALKFLDDFNRVLLAKHDAGEKKVTLNALENQLQRFEQGTKLEQKFDFERLRTASKVIEDTYLAEGRIDDAIKHQK